MQRSWLPKIPAQEFLASEVSSRSASRKRSFDAGIKVPPRLRSQSGRSCARRDLFLYSFSLVPLQRCQIPGPPRPRIPRACITVMPKGSACVYRRVRGASLWMRERLGSHVECQLLALRQSRVAPHPVTLKRCCSSVRAVGGGCPSLGR